MTKPPSKGGFVEQELAVKNAEYNPPIGGQSRTIYRALPLAVNAMLQAQGIKLEWFDEKGKFLPYGRVVKAQEVAK